MNVPAPKAADALNRLATLDLGDSEAAMQIYFELKRLAAARPGDVDLRTAMAHACQIIGYRDEAVDHLLAADALWGSADLATRSRISNLLRAFGMAEPALKRARQLSALPLMQQPPGLLQNNALAATQFGDVSLLERVAQLEIESGVPAYSIEVLSALKELGLIDFFGKLQTLVSSILHDYVVNASFGLPVHPDDGLIFFSGTFQIDGSEIHRFDLDDQVQDALDAFAAIHLSDMPDWWWRYSVVLTTAPRHASILPKPRMKAAA